jgi:hypothetical protein
MFGVGLPELVLILLVCCGLGLLAAFGLAGVLRRR